MNLLRGRVIEIWHDSPQPLLPLAVPEFRNYYSIGPKKKIGDLPQPKEPPQRWKKRGGMCYQVQCKSCHKPTWSGCGLHIEAALRGVPEADRCPNWSSRGPFRGKCAKKGAGDALGYDAGGRRVG